jgi:DnaK suppressor protein
MANSTRTDKTATEKKGAPAIRASKAKAPRKSVNGPLQFTPYKLKKSEEYMSSEQLEHFRKILQDWQKELGEEVDRTVHHMQDEAAIFPDPLDRAAQEEEFTLELRTRDRERKLVKKIEESLDMIDNQEYGYCEACGAEIGIRRLEARPTAVLCIDCKTIDEIREKQEIG